MNEHKYNPVINTEYYRCIVRRYLELNRFKTAQFWAEKVITLSNESDQDVYLYAQTLYSSREFQRAAHLLKSRNLHQSIAQCCLLAASSLAEAKEYNESMSTLAMMLNFPEEDKLNDTFTSSPSMLSKAAKPKLLGNTLTACLHLERGKVYEALDNRELAGECYKDALQADLHCYEAFDALIQHQMLTAAEEEALIKSLPFGKHCPTFVDQDIVRYLYESRLNKYRAFNVVQSIVPAWLAKRLENSLDQKVTEAERYYYNCNYAQCWRITKEVIAKDPFHTGCLPVHISCLVELKNSNDLFLLAHRLVDIYPESGVSWFAVGCYYYIIGKSDPARRYLGKATVLDRLFGPAWLAYGHSFASENEHDQAMAAYFKASQLMMGCHLPHLYIGLENGLTSNSALAEKFFQQAHEIAPNDPFVIHEMGVIAFQNEQYEKACKYFEDALSKVKFNDKYVLLNKWEPLLNNLGHVYRKLQMYDKAIDCHMQAMMLVPNSYSTYSAIGFCEVITGKPDQAVKSFHKALSLKRDDTFSTTMLNYVLDLNVQDTKDTPDFDLEAVTLDEIKAVPDLPKDEEFAMKLIRAPFENMSSNEMNIEESIFEICSPPDMNLDLTDM